MQDSRLPNQLPPPFTMFFSLKVLEEKRRKEKEIKGLQTPTYLPNLGTVTSNHTKSVSLQTFH